MVERLIRQIEERYNELTEQLADPGTIGDRERYTAVARSHRELEEAHRLAEDYRRAESDAAGAQELLQTSDGQIDASEREELQDMVASARTRMRKLEEDLRLAMVAKDPNDSKNVIVEIRAGAGGDEAALFAGDLFRMLSKVLPR